MKRIIYLRMAAFIPVLLPALLTPSAYFTGLLDTPLVGAALMILFDGAFVFGLPYLGVAALALVLLGNASERTYMRVGLAAPFVFAIVVAGMPLLSGRLSHADYSRSVGTIVGIGILVGYFYVAIAFAGLFILETLGVIGEDPPSLQTATRLRASKHL